MRRIAFPPLDDPRVKWDKYHRYHFHPEGRYNSAPFVLFSTGEFAITNNRFPARLRGCYDALGITIFRIGDPGVLRGRKLYVPGAKPVNGKAEVRKSWLSGDANLLLDGDRLCTIGRNANMANAPATFQSFSTYYANASAVPVTAETMLNVPKQYTKEEQRYIAEKKLVARTVDKMTPYTQWAKPLTTDRVLHKYGDLGEGELAGLARGMLRPSTNTIKFPYLIVA